MGRAKLKGELVTRDWGLATLGDLIVEFRQRLLHLPGTVKRTLELSTAQMLGLQKEIRAALTDLAGGTAAVDPVKRRRRRERQVKPG